MAEVAEVINTIGRRKTSVARIYLRPGKGEIFVNKRDYKEYFPLETLQTIMCQPLTTLDAIESFDIKVNVRGGGISGQAEAVRLAIARACVNTMPKIAPHSKRRLPHPGFAHG